MNNSDAVAPQKAAERKRIFSGIQPTGKLTIGNYIGAVKNWLTMTREYDCIFCAVDLHSLTAGLKPQELRQNTLQLIALYIAFGLNPDEVTLFVQSHVKEHASLSWVLNCITYLGEANRMTQFKDKSKRNPGNVNLGLLNYPVLMAADILLYKTALVPVGKDQKQHLELARNLAERFNAQYGDTFLVPEPYIPKAGAKITSLADPLVKMSKSDENENAYILVLDNPEAILRKVKRAVTDSDNTVKYAAEKPGISNLMSIYSAFTGYTNAQTEAEFSGKGYGTFKLAVAESVIAALSPVQREYYRLMGDKAYLTEVMKKGAERAQAIAVRTMEKVNRKIGLLGL